MTIGMWFGIALCAGGVMLACWLMGYEQGKAEQCRHTIYMIEKLIDDGEIDANKKHVLTHADLVQLEQERRSKEQQLFIKGKH